MKLFDNWTDEHSARWNANLCLCAVMLTFLIDNALWGRFLTFQSFMFMFFGLMSSIDMIGSQKEFRKRYPL